MTDPDKLAKSLTKAQRDARDAEMLAEGARQEREAIVAWLGRQAGNDINSAAHCRSGNAGQMLRRFAQRRKADAQAISAGQHKETNGG